MNRVKISIALPYENMHMPKLQVLGLIFDSFKKRKEKVTQGVASELVLARVPGVSHKELKLLKRLTNLCVGSILSIDPINAFICVPWSLSDTKKL